MFCLLIDNIVYDLFARRQEYKKVDTFVSTFWGTDQFGDFLFWYCAQQVCSLFVQECNDWIQTAVLSQCSLFTQECND